jgi:glycosyltransferase 2 family protein
MDAPIMKRTGARVVLAIAALGGVGGLLLVVDPRSVAKAVTHFDGGTVVPLVALGVTFYLLQGVRWHLLLRHVGGRGRMADSVLLNLAGQTVTAVLPLGDLTRALMATRASGVELGAAVATVTVQELTFTLLVVLAAAPGLARLPGGLIWMLVVVGGVGAITALLTIPRLYATARRLIARTPGVRRFRDDIDALQAAVRQLLARPGVLAGTVLDLGRVIVATAALMLVLRGLHIDAIGWWDASLVLAASFVGGALSLLPGGVGANEASVVGILVLLGVHPGAAAAAAVVQRLSLIAVPTIGGAAACLVLRARRRASASAGANARGNAYNPACPAPAC